MKAHILTHPNLINLLKLEITEYTTVLEETKYGVIIEGDFNLFYSIILNSHLAKEVLLHIGTFSSGNYKIFNDIKSIFNIKKKSMRLTSTQEIIYNESPKILNALNLTVNLKDPFYDFVILEKGKNYYCGIKLFSNLSKRDYKIYIHRMSINSLIAFSLSFSNKGDLYDPYIRDGSIVIEKSLYQNRKLRKYKEQEIIKYSKHFVDKIEFKNPKEILKAKIYASTDNLSDLKKSKMNAKIVSIKDINFLKASINDMDYKFGKESLSIISTIPQLLSKNNESNKIKDDFFLLLKQASYVLNNNGIINLYLNVKTKELLELKSIKYNELQIDNVFSIIKIKKNDL